MGKYKQRIQRERDWLEKITPENRDGYIIRRVKNTLESEQAPREKLARISALLQTLDEIEQEEAGHGDEE